MFCTNCGKKIYDGDRFCAHCGTKVRGEEAPKPQRQEIVFNPPFKVEAERRTTEIYRGFASEEPEEKPRRVTEPVNFDWNLDGFPAEKKKTEEINFNWDSVVERRNGRRAESRTASGAPVVDRIDIRHPAKEQETEGGDLLADLFVPKQRPERESLFVELPQQTETEEIPVLILPEKPAAEPEKPEIVPAAEPEKPETVPAAVPEPEPEEEPVDSFISVEDLERELFAHPGRVYGGPAPQIALCRAGSPYAEVESAAARITELVRDKGYRYRDLAVLCSDMEGRGALVKRVFGQYGIPVFMDRKKKILQDPAVVFVLSLLDVVGDGWRYEDVFRLIKSGFTAIGPDDRELLENYCIQYRIRGTAWNREFTYGQTRYGEEAMAHLNGLRAEFAALVEAFSKPFKEAETAGQRTRVLYDFLAEKAELPQKIDALRDSLTEEGLLEDAAELAQVWDALVHILDQLVELAGEEALSMTAYRDLLEAGLASVEIGLIPPAADQVVVGPARRLATGRLRALFVLGANEGLLPAENAAKDLLSRAERELLLARQEGFCKNEGWIAQEERLAIYRDFAKPEEYLWVSCSLADSEGGGSRPFSVGISEHPGRRRSDGKHEGAADGGADGD